MSSPNGRIIALSKAGNLEEVEKVLNNSSCDVNHAEWNGDTAVSMASSFGHYEVVKVLINKGADVNSKDKKGESTLMLACSKGFIDIAQLLLENGANADHQSKVGYTALMGATINGREDLIQLLVSSGATLSLKNNEGKMAADFAKTDAIRALVQVSEVTVSEEAPVVQDAIPRPPPPPVSHAAAVVEPTQVESTQPSSPPVTVPPPPPPVIASSPLGMDSDSTGNDDIVATPPPVPQSPPVPRAPAPAPPSFVPAAIAGLLPSSKPPPPRRASTASPVPPPPPPVPSVVSVQEIAHDTSMNSTPVSVPAVPTEPPVDVPAVAPPTQPAPPVPSSPPASPLSAVAAPVPALPSVAAPTVPAAPAMHALPPPPVPPAPPVVVKTTQEVDKAERSGTPASKSDAVHDLFARLVHLCQDQCAVNGLGGGRLPYETLQRRLQFLQDIYSGTGGLVESARASQQDCVTEYFALQLEKSLTEAVAALYPSPQRSIFALHVVSGEKKTLARFVELDGTLTQCMRELFEALEALGVEPLTLAISKLPKFGPPLVYELHSSGSAATSRRPSVSVEGGEGHEAEDPHTPLLPHSGNWASRLAHSLTAPGKDGKIHIFNLSRPTVAPTLRRKPSLRKFEAEIDPSVRHLLPSFTTGTSYADLTVRLSGNMPGNWKHKLWGAGAGGQDAEVVVSAMHDPTSEHVPKKDASAPEQWFTESGDSKSRSQSPAETVLQSVLAEKAERKKWDALENLAVTASASTSIAPPHSAPPPPPPPAKPAKGVVAAAVAKRSGSIESSEPTTPLSPGSTPTGRTPKRISGSLLAAMGGFDPSKAGPVPGSRPRPSVSGDTSPLVLRAPSPIPPGGVAGGGAGVYGGMASFSPRSGDSDDSLRSYSTDSSAPSVHNNNLDRPMAKARRAPTKKKFETKVEDLPPVPVVPIAAGPSSAPASGKSKGGLGSAWKAIFGSKSLTKSQQQNASSATNTSASAADEVRESMAGSAGDGLVLPGVLDDSIPDPSPVTPKTPAGGISGLFSSLGMGKLGGKSSKKHVVTQSPADTAFNMSGHMQQLQSVASAVSKVNAADSSSSSHHGALGKATKVVVQNVALAGAQLPIVGAVAVLMLQLIDLCDAYKCNMKLFLALKARMQFMYRLYFAEGGVADVAHQKGKDSVVEPFARHLEVLILDAIAYLTAFTEKGFFHKLLSGRRPQQRFAEIDADVTKCLDGLTVALQLLHVADLSAALDHLQAQKAQQEVVYEIVTDIQRRVDGIGGLQGVRSMNHAQLAELCAELGVRDASELREEIEDCEERIEDAVEKASETVRDVKSAVSGADQNFVELKEMVSGLQHSNSLRSDSIDLDDWKPKERPQIDRKQLLGSGSFGAVYGGVYQGRMAAFKVPNSHVTSGVFAANSFPELQREVRLHLKVNACPGVVQILAVALQADELCTEPCVILERSIGSLYDYLHKSKHKSKFLPSINFSLTGKLTLALQVAAAMEYISSAGLIHRDIKASNVLLFYQGLGSADGRDPDVCAKISDFGLSKHVSLESTVDMSSHASVKGTPSYLSPEAFNAQYSVASDVFAFGILLNEILTEKLPVPISVAGHQAPNIFQLKDAVCRDGHRPSLYAEVGRVGDALRRLITRCWSQEVTRRCSFSQVTIDLTNILHAAVGITKFGSVRFEQDDLEGLLDAQELPVLSRKSSRASVTTTAAPLATVSSAVTSTPAAPALVNETSSDVVSVAAVLSDPSPVTPAPAATPVAPLVPSLPPPPAPSALSTSTSAVRSLEDLNVDEVGQLMEAIQMHPLRDVLVTHRVSGLMLACCESVDDLLSSEYGLQSRGLAGGLMRKINDWKTKGVPAF